MKPKVGDKVRVVDNKHGHEFDIGEVVTIIGEDDGTYHAVNERGDRWWVNDDELQDVWYNFDGTDGDRPTIDETFSPETTAIVEMFRNAHSGKMSDYSRIEWPTAVNIARIHIKGIINALSSPEAYDVNTLNNILEDLNR